jgi:hypothetical protein
MKVLAGSLPIRNSRPKPPPIGIVRTSLSSLAARSAVAIGELVRYRLSSILRLTKGWIVI